jgi:glycosyltransferase involved in cell wall biosynthesis
MNKSITLVSIITVVYNGAKDIEYTINSVIKYKDENIEYIIIDGGSTDETIDIIKKNSRHFTHWISEPDKGIYDAMNKGIAKAAGDFVYFINCGDILLTLPVKELQGCNAALACFPVKTTEGIRQPAMGFKFFLTNTLPHQGIFYRRSSTLFFEIKYKIFADYALNIDFVKQKKKIQLFDTPIVAEHSLEGISHDKKKFKEFFEVIKNKSGMHYVIASYLFFKLQGIKKRLGR